MHGCSDVVSKGDALTVLEIIGYCLSCQSVADGHAIMAKTCNLMDVSNAVYGLANLSQDGTIIGYQMLNFSYPAEWLNLYRKHELHKLDPIVLENFSNYRLQYWTDTYQKHGVDKEFRHLSEGFGLRGGYASGVVNRSKTQGCLLSLAGNLKNHPRNSYILNNLSPHLHNAFGNLLSEQSRPKSLLQISLREKQVLDWVSHGKTTWDISVILSISERTVKFHIDNVMKKLDAVSRTHAVAIALTEGLLDLA